MFVVKVWLITKNKKSNKKQSFYLISYFIIFDIEIKKFIQKLKQEWFGQKTGKGEDPELYLFS